MQCQWSSVSVHLPAGPPQCTPCKTQNLQPRQRAEAQRLERDDSHNVAADNTFTEIQGAQPEPIMPESEDEKESHKTSLTGLLIH